MVKNLPAMWEDGWGSIPDLGRCPEDGHGNPLQYSGLENPMDRGAWQGTVRGPQRVGHNLVANTHSHTGKPCIGLRNLAFFCVGRGQPLNALLSYAPQLSIWATPPFLTVCILNSLFICRGGGWLLCISPPPAPRQSPWRVEASAWIAGIVFPLGSPHPHLELQIAGIAGSWDISCPPTDMAGNVHFSASLAEMQDAVPREGAQ